MNHQDPSRNFTRTLPPSKRGWDSHLLAILIALLFSSSCKDIGDPVRTNYQNDFGIYFLEDTTLKIQDILSKDLSQLKLQTTPWISTEDIDFYDWSSHCIYLRKDKSYFFPSFPSLFQASWSDRPFITVVNGERCYAGYFLSAISGNMQPNPDILDAYVLSYPPDIINVEWPYPFANDIRDHDKVKHSLSELQILREGIAITIDSLWISNDDTSTVRYVITVKNTDADNLYVLDPDKMGTELFHAFTNGPMFYNTDSKTLYESIYKKVTTPSPPDSYDPTWFMKIESGKSLTRTISLNGYPRLSVGNYYCKMGFANPSSILRTDRVLEDGRYWIGFTSSELVGFRFDSGMDSPQLEALSQR